MDVKEKFQEPILLDAVALRRMIEYYPVLLERLDNMERLLGVYKKDYSIKMLSLEHFMKKIDITRSTFRAWAAADLISFVQHGKGNISVPQSEVTRINELCNGVAKKLRSQHLITLKEQTISV